MQLLNIELSISISIHEGYGGNKCGYTLCDVGGATCWSFFSSCYFSGCCFCSSGSIFSFSESCFSFSLSCFSSDGSCFSISISRFSSSGCCFSGSDSGSLISGNFGCWWENGLNSEVGIEILEELDLWGESGRDLFGSCNKVPPLEVGLPININLAAVLGERTV